MTRRLLPLRQLGVPAVTGCDDDECDVDDPGEIEQLLDRHLGVRL